MPQEFYLRQLNDKFKLLSGALGDSISNPSDIGMIAEALLGYYATGSVFKRVQVDSSGNIIGVLA